MRAIPDRWNPRLWLRDWLIRPSRDEQARAEARATEIVDFNAAIQAALERAFLPGTGVLHRTASDSAVAPPSGGAE